MAGLRARERFVAKRAFPLALFADALSRPSSGRDANCVVRIGSMGSQPAGHAGSRVAADASPLTGAGRKQLLGLVRSLSHGRLQQLYKIDRIHRQEHDPGAAADLFMESGKEE